MTCQQLDPLSIREALPASGPTGAEMPSSCHPGLRAPPPWPHMSRQYKSLTCLPSCPCRASPYKQFLGIGTEAHGREGGPGTPAHRSPATSSGHTYPSIGPYPEPKSLFLHVLNVRISPGGFFLAPRPSCSVNFQHCYGAQHVDSARHRDREA